MELSILTKHYNEPHRKYHNLTHIAKLFSITQRLNLQITVAQCLAIWWHGAVYIPGAKDNEEKSVELMYEHSDYNHAAKAIASTIILDTKHHKATIKESEIVCDLDMFVFAEDDLAYNHYESNVMEEYVRYFKITPEVYIKGRIKFLEQLQLTNIFNSEVFKQYEDKAQSRITRVLKELKE
jgi:predicted metal-dependent HD superfamily phosphohydrolase